MRIGFAVGIATAALLTLSACELITKETKKARTDVASALVNDRLSLVFGEGMESIQGLKSGRQINRVIRDLFRDGTDAACGDRSPSKTCIAQARAFTEENVRGLSRVLDLQLLDILAATGANRPVEADIGGKIQDYCLDKHGEPDRRPGYFFDGKNLRLCVVVRTIITNGVRPASSRAKLEYYEVNATNVGVDRRCTGGVGCTAASVFPAAFDATKIAIPDTKRIGPGETVIPTHKLYASNLGEPDRSDVRVVAYGVIPNIAANPSDPIIWPAGNKIIFAGGPGSGDPAVSAIFTPGEDDCVDMMFDRDPPPTFASLGTDFAYCLGRCQDPPVVNTR
ncbi:MAG: hypothetical protein AAGH68_00520 [Pseudomonadota bacterium]